MDLSQKKSDRNHGIFREQVKPQGLWVLVLFLMLLVSITSSCIGYLLSSKINDSRFTGQIVDTIEIFAGDAVRERTYQVNISGTIYYTDGTPYANGVVELRSEVRRTTTDELGRFIFENVPEGTHKLSIIENDQAVLSRTVTIQKSSLIVGANVKRNDDGSYLIHVPIDIVQVDLLLELHDDNVALILKGSSSQSEYFPNPDANPGTAIKPGFPAASGTTTPPTNPPAGTGQPTEAVPPAETTEPTAPVPPVEAEPPATPLPPVTPTTPTGPTTPVNPDPGTPAAPSAGITVTDGTAASRVWTKATAIDIFAEREGNSGVRKIKGKNVIAPGAKGRYIFRIKNNEALTAVYSIALKETDQNNPKLPMRYRIRQGVSGSNYIGGSDWKEAKDLLVTNAELAAGADTYYALEWQWGDQSDSENTAIGMQEGDPVYILEINIRANIK